MSAHTEQHKLAAIMFTDIVEYLALAQRWRRLTGRRHSESISP